MDKFRHKLPKEDLKRFARDINKKLVASDFKNNRVKDPTAPLGNKEERKVKKYVKDFFDKAVVKFQEHEKRRKAKEGANGAGKTEKSATELDSSSQMPAAKDDSLVTDDAEPDDMVMTDDEDGVTPGSPDRKRKRESVEETPDTPLDEPSTKRSKEDEGEEASPPPPPPPPPDAVMEDVLTDDQKALREQEEALIRENEEAQRLEDEAEQEKKRQEEEALVRENEEAMRDFEAATKQNAGGFKKNDGLPIIIGSGHQATPDADSSTPEESHTIKHDDQARKQEVLSH